MSLDVQKLRAEFPALKQLVNGNPLVYLDSAATSLKPKAVIDRLNQFYSLEAANVHRGAHFLSDRATELFESARNKVAQFINASSSKEIIFVRGTTEGINLVASSFGATLNEGDEIIVSEVEHHANIVPWQLLAEKRKLKIKVLTATQEGSFSMPSLTNLITPRTKLLAITHASNLLGNVVELKPLIKVAHSLGVKVLVDGAQAVGKIMVDVQALDADFYVFSGHKMFAPFGIGVLYGKEEILKEMPPYQGGGSMISQVSFAKTTFNEVPFRFEAGTPDVGGAIALAAAIDFIHSIGLASIESHENELVRMAFTKLAKVEDLELLGPLSGTKIPVFSFNIKNLHGSDIGFLLNQQGIAVRTGHHCTQPLLQKLNLTGSVRASFSIYNTEEEIELLIAALNKSKELLS